MIPSPKFFLLAVTTVLLAVIGAAADAAMPTVTPGMPAATMDPGLKVGDTAPEFTLPDASGRDVSLASLRAKGKVALVFYRSGDWCPFCIEQLQELQAHLSDFEAIGAQVVGISYDPPEMLLRSATRHSLKFTMLSDVGSKTIDAFGIRNLEAKGKAEGVPHPAVFIVDEAGVIRAKLMRDGYRTRARPAEIIAAISRLP